jgi:putative ABC transport system permease protein
VPLLAWAGGVLLGARLLLALATRLRLPAPPGFGAPVGGLLKRSVRRRPWELAAGVVALGLVVAFGTSLRAFIATYDEAKRADARFVVGSDLRVSAGASGALPRTAGAASQLRVGGVTAVTPVVFRLENSVAIGTSKRAITDLAAIDPSTFGRAALLSDSSFVGRSPSAAMAALRADPRGVLLDAATADELSLERGDRVRIVLALGTSRETTRAFRVAGLFTRFTGFARPPNLIVGLRAYRAATTLERVDFFLARTADHGHAGLTRAVAALRSERGAGGPLAIQTSEAALGKDQSSLTALHVRGLVDLGSLFTLLMCGAVLGVFMFGLLLQRRREYVVLRAQGMHAREVRSLVLGEAALVAVGGLASGLLVGAGSGFLLVQVLRPLFIVPPAFALPAGALAVLGLAAVAATLASAFATLAALRRVSPTEILREQ